MTIGSGDFSIGSTVWPGTSKLIEEMGELQQVLGKLIAVAGEAETHWSGDLRAKFIEEIGDTEAALSFFREMNFTKDERRKIEARAREKRILFRKWHEEHSGLPSGGKVFHLPVPNRQRSSEEDARLNAATEWLLCELEEPPTVDALRKLAQKELERPRSGIHRDWAACFLKETEEYAK